MSQKQVKVQLSTSQQMQSFLCGNQVCSPSNTTIYMKGLNIPQGREPSVVGPINFDNEGEGGVSTDMDCGSDDCRDTTVDDLVNKTSSLVLGP